MKPLFANGAIGTNIAIGPNLLRKPATAPKICSQSLWSMPKNCAQQRVYMPQAAMVRFIMAWALRSIRKAAQP